MKGSTAKKNLSFSLPLFSCPPYFFFFLIFFVSSLFFARSGRKNIEKGGRTQEKKDWTMAQWFDHNKASNGQRIRTPGKEPNTSKAPNSGGKPWARNPRHPPGYAKRKLANSTGPGKAEREKPKMEDTPGVKKSLVQNSTASRRKEKGPKVGKNGVADGLASVGGLQCHLS